MCIHRIITNRLFRRSVRDVLIFTTDPRGQNRTNALCPHRKLPITPQLDPLVSRNLRAFLRHTGGVRGVLTYTGTTGTCLQRPISRGGRIVA